MRRLVLLGCFILINIHVLLSPIASFARGVGDWRHEKLFQKSDLVVLATPVSNADSGETMNPENYQVKFLGVNTTFTDCIVLKGQLTDKEIKVLHYRLPDDAPGQQNGPLLTYFHIGGVSLSKVRDGKVFGEIGGLGKQYILFLKKRDDGRYEPVSGQIDSNFSFLHILGEPLPADVFKKDEKGTQFLFKPIVPTENGIRGQRSDK